MQTSLPASAPAVSLSTPLDGVPAWLICVIGFVLIGIAACLIVAALRSAFPPSEDPKAKKFHPFYPFLTGMALGEALPVALPGFGYDSRWFIGLLAPFLWVLVYNYYKGKAEKVLGVKLPEAGDIVSGISSPGGKS